MSDDRTPPSRLARLLFGGAVGFMAVGNFFQMEEMIQYAESKDVPMADVAVPFASGMATFGALGVVLWRLPTLAAGAVATFLAGVTPTMHDFWNLDDEQQRQQQQFQFLKNVGLFGTALAFIGLARSSGSSDDSGGGGDADGSGTDEGGFVDLDVTDEAGEDSTDDGDEAVTPDAD